MKRLGLLLFASACAHHTPAPAPAKPAAPAPDVDPAKHTVSMIEVAPAVKLEVVDYGGTGDAIVFLAGLGNTAHVWDDFAPQFTDHHRVLAITRRGFGVSSGPEDGYDVPTRANDDLAVLDAMHVDRAVFIGHSIAGDELTELAGAHADRVKALVYIDAAHDHARVRALLAKMPQPEPPPPSPDDLASAPAFAKWMAAQSGLAFPFGEVLAQFQFGPDGKFVGPRGRPDAGQKIIDAATSQDFTKVHAPALVFAARPDGPEDMVPGFAKMDAKTQQTFRDTWPDFAKLTQDTVDDVKAHLASVQLVEFPHGQHYLFIQHAADVAAQMRQFMGD